MKKLFLSLFLFCIASLTYSLQRNYFYADVFNTESDIPQIFDAEYYDNVVGNKFIWDLTFEEWFKGPQATGGWLGSRRQLEKIGIIPIVSYLGNFAANPVGGNARGATNTSSVNLGLGIDLEKLTGMQELSGWSLGNTWVWRFGDSLTKGYIDNTFNVQQNYGNQTIRLQGLFAQYQKGISADDWTVTFKFGRFSAGDNFLTKPIYWMYQNNAFDGNPVGIFNQIKWSAYPVGTWAAYGNLKYKDGQYLRAGVYQIANAHQESVGMHGLDWSFHGDGVNANFELGWDINHDASKESPGNISVGLAADWTNTPHQDNPLVASNFTYTVYLQADYMIWNLGYIKKDEPYYITRSEDSYRDLRGLILWGVVEYNPDQNLAYMPLFINGGLLFNAPFVSRADDVVCFGIAYGKYSNKLNAYENDSYEIALELNYKFQVNRFAFIQPNIQGIINPKGGKYSDALVLGIQFGLNL